MLLKRLGDVSSQEGPLASLVDGEVESPVPTVPSELGRTHHAPDLAVSLKGVAVAMSTEFEEEGTDVKSRAADVMKRMTRD